MQPEHGAEEERWCDPGPLTSHNLVLSLRALCRELLAATNYAYYSSQPDQVLADFKRNFGAIVHGRQQDSAAGERDIERREKYNFMATSIEKFRSDWRAFRDLFPTYHIGYEPFDQRVEAEVGKKWNYYHPPKPKT